MNRLQTRPQFQAVLNGTTLARTAHFALHSMSLRAALPQDLQSLGLFVDKSGWLGAMVPKRWAKRAVTRNAIKRQIYSVAAHSAGVLSDRAYVVRLRSGFDRAVFVSASSVALKRAVRAELFDLLGKYKG